MVQKIVKAFPARFGLLAVAVLALVFLAAKADSGRAQRRAEATRARYDRIHEAEVQMRAPRESRRTNTTKGSDREPAGPSAGTSQPMW
jgi:hypothetical protein